MKMFFKIFFYFLVLPPFLIQTEQIYATSCIEDFRELKLSLGDGLTIFDILGNLDCERKNQKTNTLKQKSYNQMLRGESISLETVRTLYSKAYPILNQMQEKVNPAQYSKPTACETLMASEPVLEGLTIEYHVENALATCDILAIVDLPCTKALTSGDVFEALNKADSKNTTPSPIITQPETESDSLSQSLPPMNDVSLMFRVHDLTDLFLRNAFPRILELLPRKNDQLEIQETNERTKIFREIFLPIKPDKNFENTLAWEPFFDTFKTVVEQFWKGSFDSEDPNCPNCVIRVFVEDALEQDEAIPITLHSNPYGVQTEVDPLDIFITLSPDIASKLNEPENGYIVNHQVGHILGFTEASGYFVEEEEDCSIGYYKSKKNIMNQLIISQVRSLQNDQKLKLYKTYFGQPSKNQVSTRLWQRYAEVAEDLFRTLYEPRPIPLN